MRVRSLKQAALLLAAFVTLLVPGTFGRPVPAAEAQGCTIAPRFAEIQSLAADVVGDCVEHERTVPVTGDVLQRTSHGLLVWRREDSWTAFSTDHATWVLGPYGLQWRTSDSRFSWEPDARFASQMADGGAAPNGEVQSLVRLQEDAATDEPTETPEPVSVGNLTASGVPESAQVARFAFQATIDRPGNFKVDATFDVSGPGSIAHTNGLFTSSEQGNFAPQPYDPAPVVNGKRSRLHWPPDLAETPMGVQGKANGDVFVQCTGPGTVTGNLTLKFVQGGANDLTFRGTARVECSDAPVFVPTPQPTDTPQPTATHTETPTSTETATETETPTLEPGVATSEALAAGTATQAALGTATADTLGAIKLDVSSKIDKCTTTAVDPVTRLITIILSFFQGGDPVDNATVRGELRHPDGTTEPVKINTDNNGNGNESFSVVEPTLTGGTPFPYDNYSYTLDNATFDGFPVDTGSNSNSSTDTTTKSNQNVSLQELENSNNDNVDASGSMALSDCAP